MAPVIIEKHELELYNEDHIIRLYRALEYWTEMRESISEAIMKLEDFDMVAFESAINVLNTEHSRLNKIRFGLNAEINRVEEAEEGVEEAEED